MRRFFSSIFLCLLLVTSYGLRVTRPAHAFSLHPAIFDLSVQPGGTQTGTISVVNDEKSERPYYLSIQKFFPKGESGQQDFLPLSDTSGLPSWLYISEPVITLKPGETKAIPFIIRTPLDAQAGGYYAAIFFSTEPPLQKPTGQILAGARTGTLVFLTVEGQLTHHLEVKDFSVSPASSNHLPVLFHTRVENTGNIHTIPSGSIIIKNSFGSESARLPINPLESRILPNSAREFFTTWQKSDPKSGTGFWHEASEEWKNFAIGKYTATLDMTDVPWSSSQTFFIWPWHLFVCFVGLLILLALFLRLYRIWIVHRATIR